MSSDDGKHISSNPPQVGFLRHSEIDEFDVFFFFVIKDIFRFDIPMADVLVVKAGDS